jgi:predicted CoA-binding protein
VIEPARLMTQVNIRDWSRIDTRAMASDKARFFDSPSFVVVGNTVAKGFPVISYRNLRRMGKTVYPVDLGGAAQIEGDEAFASVDAIPGQVEAAILELPRSATMDGLRAVVDAGIRRVWFHQKSDTPEAVSFCRQNGVDFHTGGCAVMYTNDRLSYHSIHKGLWKMLRRY